MKKSALFLCLLLSVSLSNTKDSNVYSKLTRGAAIPLVLQMSDEKIDEYISSSAGRRVIKNVRPGLALATGEGTAANLIAYVFPSQITPGNPDEESYTIEQCLSDSLYLGSSVAVGELLETEAARCYIMPVAKLVAECVELGKHSLGLAENEKESEKNRNERIERNAKKIAHYSITFASQFILAKATEKAMLYTLKKQSKKEQMSSQD